MTKARKGEREAKIATLGRVLQRGATAAQSQEATWEELKDLIGLRTRTAEAETRRRYAADRVLTSDQAMMLVGSLIAAAREVLIDMPDRFRLINDRVVQLLGPEK